MSILYRDTKSFWVLETKVHLYSEVLEIGLNTVAEVDTHTYYLGREKPTVYAAITAWQKVNGRELTSLEISRVLSENRVKP